VKADRIEDVSRIGGLNVVVDCAFVNVKADRIEDVSRIGGMNVVVDRESR
jgi:hypothetical protein